MMANWITALERKLASEAVLKLNLKIDLQSRLTRHIAQLTYLPSVVSWLRRCVLSKISGPTRFGSVANTAYAPALALVSNVAGKSVAVYIGKLPAIVAHGRF